MTHQSCSMSSHVMKCGIIITTLKQSKKVQPGGPCDHQRKSRSARLNLLSDAHYFFSQMCNHLSSCSAIDKTEPSILSIIVSVRF